MSANEFNVTPIRTVIVAFLTTNAARATDPGNVWVTARQTGLPYSSTVNVTQLASVDRRIVTEKIGRLPDSLMALVDEGLRMVLAL